MLRSQGKKNNSSKNGMTKLKIVSHNMTGYSNITTSSIIKSHQPNVLLFQETWHAHINDQHQIDGFQIFDKTSMDLDKPLIGRPYGGVITYIDEKLNPKPIVIEKDLIIVQISQVLIVNAYMPFQGSKNQDRYTELLAKIEEHCEDCCNIVIGMDANISDPSSLNRKEFLSFYKALELKGFDPDEKTYLQNTQAGIVEKLNDLQV